MAELTGKPAAAGGPPPPMGGSGPGGGPGRRSIAPPPSIVRAAQMLVNSQNDISISLISYMGFLMAQLSAVLLLFPPTSSICMARKENHV